jgi:DNA-binding transcriptional MerR regulator
VPMLSFSQARFPLAASAVQRKPGGGRRHDLTLTSGHALTLGGMPEVDASLSIGEVAERTGLSVHTLRFYEREGMLTQPVRRGPGGRRVYDEWDVEWLTMCTRLRASGMPLTAIRRYAELIRQGAGNESERLAVLREHQQRIVAQIVELTACLDLISYKVRVYEDHLAEGTAHHLWTSRTEAEEQV